MTWLTIFAIAAMAGAWLFLRRGNETNIKLADIPVVFAALKKNGKDASWAQFCFGIGNKSDRDNAVNLQFSIEDGRIGFDWFLLAPINIRDQEKFRQFATDRGHQLTEHKYENGSQSLRTEDGDLVKLCETLLREFYHWPDDAAIGMIWDGFDWP